MGPVTMWVIWFLQLLISFLVTFVVIGTLLCANMPPMLVSIVSKKNSKKLSAAINASTALM